MDRGGQESDLKAHLVTKICSISTCYVACAHRHGCSRVKSRFVDWYRVLGVEENEETDVIRKRYHKLALQLHPDKNKHPKAEIAFKLVSEAYTCLSDSARRRAFDLERWKNFCLECNTIPYTTCGTTRRHSSGSANKARNLTSQSRSHKIWECLKDIRERFKEEAKVIENCLRAKATSRKESSLLNPADCLFPSNNRPQKESPIFNPSDYSFHGYPHLRTRVCRKPANYWYLQTGSLLNYEQGSRRYDTPIFEVRSQREILRSKPAACVRS
ncbi:Chaperone protein dnaJ 49 [Morella rubra]|uniref:Chaperone protein dnaJ 49 n=1 Tax=Morella rubra TaxID=262757 RepID=A0A6A1VQM9_9ROSI|nr:Chaperone protein dnaJ 49 [Morella rubra]